MTRLRALDALRLLTGAGAFALTVIAALWAAELLQVAP